MIEMQYWKWIAIEIISAIIGVISYYFFSNIIITYAVLAIVIISAIMSLRKEFAEDTGVEISG
jgi:CBS-domain-containing membrane protein